MLPHLAGYRATEMFAQVGWGISQSLTPIAASP